MIKEDFKGKKILSSIQPITQKTVAETVLTKTAGDGIETATDIMGKDRFILLVERVEGNEVTQYVTEIFLSKKEAIYWWNMMCGEQDLICQRKEYEEWTAYHCDADKLIQEIYNPNGSKENHSVVIVKQLNS